MAERAPQPEAEFASIEQQERQKQAGFQRIIDFLDGVREHIVGK